MLGHSPHPEVTSEALLEIVRGMSSELRPHLKSLPSITLDSAFDRVVGFDSLARVELLTRIEHTFDIKMPEEALGSVETPRDLLRVVLAAKHMRRPEAYEAKRHAVPSLVEQASDTAETLLDTLEWHVRAHPDRIHIVLESDAGEETRISYVELYHQAMAIAVGLLDRGLRPGSTVAIMLPTCSAYFFSFTGVLLAGGVPVPIYPPARASQIGEHLRRHAGILSNALAQILITVPEAKPLAALLKARVETLRHVATADELAISGDVPGRVARSPDSIALLQYTSGSTGDPKGVVLTHANLLANIRAMGQAIKVSSQDVFVSWLPLYHDMGLIGAWLGSLHFAYPLVVMSPLTFLARPERWLWSIHRNRGTLSGGPNFAYELCLRKVDERALEGLDLGSWRFAFNGAEPVSPQTMRAFGQRFARFGLRPEALAPVYGLAEASVGLTFPPIGRGLAVDRINRHPFEASGKAITVDAIEHDVLEFVACGRPLPCHEVRVVDGTGREMAERQEGRLQFKGPSATGGYFRNTEQTQRLFVGEWLDTGDYAYVAEGELYLTGRVKDVIFRGGRNIYPYELEQAVGLIPGIRKGCVAVFGSADPTTGTERIVVMAETRETDAKVLECLREQVQSTAVDALGIPADDIALVPPHTVLKTSSGKIRRTASRECYQSGDFTSHGAPLWWQLALFAWRAALPQLRRSGRVIAEFAYAVYAWGPFWTLALPTWSIAVALPRAAWGWAVSHLAARLLLRLTGTPFHVEGLDHLPRHQSCVVVANHASYLDGIILVAALARHFSFVAKRELRDQFVSRAYLSSIGAEFVDRADPYKDADRLVSLVRAGRSMVFFPEGTFQRAPGLQAFRVGAFVAAARAGVPVVPVTLHGTRSALRDGQWFPRRSTIRVMIDAPIWPEGDDWSAAIRLRDAARAAILQRCGEPDAALSTVGE